MKRILFLLGMLLCGCPSLMAQWNYPVDTTLYVGYAPTFRPDERLMVHPTSYSTRAKSRLGLKATTTLPDHWNNADQTYAPPPINQGAFGSCGVSSRVGHMMTYEMNAYNNTDGSLLVNQLTPMFQYPFTYHGPGKDVVAIHIGYPDAKIYGGRYVSSIYGGYDHSSSVWGWVQGYETFYNAAKNRIEKTSNFPVSVASEKGREAVKWWLYNHNGDEDFEGRGGVCGIGVGISGLQQGTIGTTDANTEAGVVGKNYVKHWRLNSIDHAMCIVGYDDRIEFDLDGNGVYGEESNLLGQNETGAWIIVNSWGPSWSNSGYIYCPYALAAPMSTEKYIYTDSDGNRSLSATNAVDSTKVYVRDGSYSPEIYWWRKDYTPQQMVKATMNYSHRSEIQVIAGIAQDTAATTPEATYVFKYINNTGDGDGDGVDAATPLLGKWADGEMHYEDMEFGIDITDMAAEFDLSKPVRYFLQVVSKAGSNGSGYIAGASIMDYSFDADGVEYPYLGGKTTIETGTNATTTTISWVVCGEELAAPTNVAIDGTTLTWQAPTTGLTLSGYQVYKDGTLLATVDASTTSYTLSTAGGEYYVKAVYGDDKLSPASNSVSAKMDCDNLYDSKTIWFTNSGFVIPNISNQSYSNFTLEFWEKVGNKNNYFNKLFDTGWRDSGFMVHSNANGGLSVGWSESDRLKPSSNKQMFGDYGTSVHVAIVVKSDSIFVYKNGSLFDSYVSTAGNSGVPISAFGDGGLHLGCDADGGNAFRGQVDEVKVWSCARTAAQVAADKDADIANPTSTPNLLAYLKMEAVTTSNDMAWIKDWAHGNDAYIVCSTEDGVTSKYAEQDGSFNSTSNISSSTHTPSIKAESETVYAGYATTFDAQNADWAGTLTWTATEADGTTTYTSTSRTPSFTFAQTGTATVKVVASDDCNSIELSATQSITVAAAPAPSAYFNVSAEQATCDERISCTPTNTLNGCTYAWSMPDAATESATSRNAVAAYSAVGYKTITLTVTDGAGNSASYSRKVKIVNEAPELAYSIIADEYQTTPNITTKGTNVTLTDESSGNPTNFVWRFSNGKAIYNIETTDNPTSFTPTRNGIYTLYYKASNEVGAATLKASRALTVCNEKSYNGLNFQSGNTLSATFNSSSTTPSTAWTVEYWLRPSSMTGGTQPIKIYTDDDNYILISTNGSGGRVKVAYVGSSASGSTYSSNVVYIAEEWHHYAITFNSGTLSFYRDGEYVSGGYGKLGITDCSSYCKTGFVIGSSDNSFAGDLDEFKIWSKVRSQQYIQSGSISSSYVYSTATSNGMLVHYTFNQTDTNNPTITDAAGLANGTYDTNGRNMGDCWTDSEGVFALDYESADEADDVSSLTELDRSDYRVYAVSDEQPNGANTNYDYADHALDGNTSTMWHSQWYSSVSYPHTITIHRVNPDTITALQLRQRAGDSYWAGNVKVEESEDATTWSAVDYAPLAKQQNTALVLSSPITKPYFRLSFVNGQNSSSALLAIYEINFYGKEFERTLNEVEISYVGCNSNETSGKEGSNAVDGDESTYWLTSSDNHYPHILTLKNDNSSEINVLRIVGTGDYGLNYWPGSMNVLVSDDGSNFTTLATGVRLPHHQDGLVELPEAITSPYFRLRFVRNQSGDTATYKQLGIAEVKAYNAKDLAYMTWNVESEDGVILKTFTATYEAGEDISAYPAEMADYAASHYAAYVPSTPSTTSATTTTETVSYNVNTPFSVASSTDTTYYYLALADSLVSTGGALHLTPTSSYNSTAAQKLYNMHPAYRWAFFGDPFSGFTLKDLYADSAVSVGSTNKWEVIQVNDDTFAIKTLGAENYWNNGGGTIALAGKQIAATVKKASDVCDVLDGGYYRLKSQGNTYLVLDADAPDTLRHSVSDPADVPDAVFDIALQDGGTYTLSADGIFVAEQTATAQPIAAGEAKAANIYYCPELGAHFVQLGTEGVTRSFLFYNANLGYATIWGPNVQNALWTLEPVKTFDVPITYISGNSYATRVLPFDVSLSDEAAEAGHAIYVVSGVADGTAQTTKLTTGAPAGTPFLIVSDNEDATLTLQVGTLDDTEADATAFESNMLHGGFTADTLELHSFYILSYVTENGENVPGFYWTNSTVFPAYRAYLLYSSNTRGLALVIGDEVHELPTGLQTPAVDIDASNVFDLQGRKWNRLQKGVNIVNGKKVIVK